MEQTNVNGTPRQAAPQQAQPQQVREQAPRVVMHCINDACKQELICEPGTVEPLCYGCRFHR